MSSGTNHPTERNQGLAISIRILPILCYRLPIAQLPCIHIYIYIHMAYCLAYDIACCILSVAFCIMGACYLLPIAYWLLSIACWLLLTVQWILLKLYFAEGLSDQIYICRSSILPNYVSPELFWRSEFAGRVLVGAILPKLCVAKAILCRRYILPK